jgi:hypothetical protein
MSNATISTHQFSLFDQDSVQEEQKASPGHNCSLPQQCPYRLQEIIRGTAGAGNLSRMGGTLRVPTSKTSKLIE